MVASHVEQAVQKILKEDGYSYPQNLAMACAWMMGNFKAEGLKVIEIGAKSSLTDFFVIGTAQNSTQLSAMASETKRVLKSMGHVSLSEEGTSESGWVLIDYGDIMAHIFLPAAREMYDLESLWREAPRKEIPQDYYTSTPHVLETSSGSAGDYF